MGYDLDPEVIRLCDVWAVDNEVLVARCHGEKFASLHECYAVIAEELDELWDITRMKRKDRDSEQIRKELIQIAAMAFKGMLSMKNFTGGDI